MRDHKTSLAAVTSAAALFLVAGCATYGEKNLRDFNADFQTENPVNPQYSIRALGTREGEITLHQGSILISPTAARHRHLEEAGKLAIATHCAKSDETVRGAEFQWHGTSGYVHVTGTFTCAPDNFAAAMGDAIAKGVLDATTCSAKRAVKLMEISKDLAYIEKSAIEDCSAWFDRVSETAARLYDSPSFIEEVDDFAQREARKEVRKAVLRKES